MNIAEEAFRELYPDKDASKYAFDIKYSGKFTSYNANVRYSGGRYEFNLSREWEDISKEIKIGLIQHLLQRIFKTKMRTISQDLYESFLRNVHIAVPKENVDPYLKIVFDKVNEAYFLGLVEQPNLIFGQESFNKLGSYQYGNDTITISSIFRGLRPEEERLLEYVMYHEMLHKVHKFRTVNGRSKHHTTKFRHAERQFEDADKMESELRRFIRGRKVKSYLGLRWL
jgi:hypothetical protein